MKYCHACGKAIDDDTVFCPFCGTRQEASNAGDPEPDSYSEQDSYGESDPYADPYAESEQDYYQQDTGYADPDDTWNVPADEPPKKKKASRKKKKAALKLGIIIGSVVVVAAAVVLLLLTGAIGALLPHSKAKLKLAEANLMKEVAGYADGELDTVKNLDMSYTVSAKIAPNEAYRSSVQTAEIVNKLKLSGGIQTGGKDLKFSSSADYKGNELLSVMLFLNEKEIGAYTSLIDDEYYTCKIDDLARLMGADTDDLPDSGKLQDTDLLKKDLKKAATAAFKALFKAKTKISTGKTVKLFGDDEKTVKGVAIYQISPTEKEWKAIMVSALDAAAYKGSYLYSALEYSAEMSGSRKDADDMLDELYDGIDQLAETLAEQELKIEVVMKGNTIIRQRLYNDEGEAGYDAYTSGKESRVFVYSGSNERVYPFVDIQTTKNGRTYDLEVTFGQGSSKVRFTGTGINPGKVSPLGIPVGEYSFKLDDNRIDFNVAQEGKGMNHELRIRFDTGSRYRDFDSVSVVLYTEKGAKITKPKGLETVDISDYSNAELQKLAQKLSTKLSNIAQKVMD